MNPETLLNLTEIAIKKRPFSCNKQYHIAFMNGAIVCVSTAQLVPKSQIVGTFTDDDLKKGLTCKQWDRLTIELALLYFKEPLK